MNTDEYKCVNKLLESMKKYPVSKKARTFGLVDISTSQNGKLHNPIRYLGEYSKGYCLGSETKLVLN